MSASFLSRLRAAQFRSPTTYSEAVLQALLWGIFSSPIAFGLLLFAVFATGSTFGQRCSVEYEKDSTEWRQCVSRLSEGGAL